MTTTCNTYYHHTDLNATTGAVTHRYYVRDYLGSIRAVVDEIRQALMSNGLNFSKNGYLQNPGIYSSSSKRLGDISNNEVDAYKAQYSFDKSFPIFINSISDITVHSIGNLKDGNNKDMYPFIKSYSYIINSQNK